MKKIRLSVHQLVDFLLRKGDIDNRFFNQNTLKEGSSLHKYHQSRQGKNYISEYPLKNYFIVDETEIILEGRADGIINIGKGHFIIDEIKTTNMSLLDFKNQNIEWHLGQAKCYALMFALERGLESIGIRLTYIKQGSKKDKLLEEYQFSIYELTQYVQSLLEDYLSFSSLIDAHIKERNNTISNISFPYIHFRDGQKKLIKYAYGIAKNGGNLYCEAPTGIGKTISTLFPFIKSLELDDEAKIFYLTAKTSGRASAYNTIEILKEQGLILNDIVITAKDKICPCKDKNCNPDECPFAKGYYNKLQSVLKFSILNYSSFDYKTILQIANENQMCPFEFELDLSLFCDAIICDYNYLFDPISHMKRYFDDDSSHYLALIDEAHNLIDRSREMYSASINLNDVLNAKHSIKEYKGIRIKKHLNKIIKFLEEKVADNEEGIYENIDFRKELLTILESFHNCMSDIKKDEKFSSTSELTNFHIEATRFIKINDYYNEKYISYLKKSKNNIEASIFCLDASDFIRKQLLEIKGSVLFSATLSPINYYVDTLGGRIDIDSTLILPSPFPKKNFNLMVAPKVSTIYKNRNETYPLVAEYVKTFIKQKTGNYFIFSPSYEYMENLLTFFKNDDFDIFVQDKSFNDQQKEDFLLNFKEKPTKTSIGFLVLGGAFSEGIDMVDDRLIGAVVIGIGLPKINFESDKIANYYKNTGKPGHDYAYTNPGMNKVMQAVGRVIRSETDKGSVLLIDERYMRRQYHDLFKLEWNHYRVVYSPSEVEENLQNFYKS